MAAAREVDVTDWDSLQQEARGSAANKWLRDPQGVQWLYKATRVPERSGEAQGEDWAEKAVERLAGLLGLPCATVELAYAREGSDVGLGVISRDLVLPRTELQNGS